MSCQHGWSIPPHMDKPPSLQTQLDGICLGLVKDTEGSEGHWDEQIGIPTTQILSSKMGKCCLGPAQ